jgi:uncharacterized protein (DUF58 family)
MRFVLTPRAFVLPACAGIVLTFQRWIPGALPLVIACNCAALVLIVIDYFMVPGPDALTVVRHPPPRLFLLCRDTVRLVLRHDVRVPCRVSLLDRPPATLNHDHTVQSIVCAGGFGETEWCYHVTPRVRGLITFESVGVRIATRLGLVYRSCVLRIPQTVQVFPRMPTEQEGLLSHYYMSQIESRIQRTYGPGREFSQMREYRRGDDIRAIHWKRSARVNTLVVKEFEPEKGQNVLLMIDGGRLMLAETDGMSKVDWALASGISLAREAIRRHDAVGALGFSNRVETFIQPSNKAIQLPLLVKSIYAFQPSFIEPDYRTVFLWLTGVLRHRCIIVLYTDFLDPALSAELSLHIKLLKRNHRVICCAMGHNQLEQVGYGETTTLSQAMLAAVARESLDNRRKVLADLTHAGVDVIDVAPHRICAAVLNGYARARWG